MNGLPPIVKERPPEGTRRVLLTVSYDGTAYAGWQWQDNALSVQQVLEEAPGPSDRRKTRVTGASRTDAGVHALGQRAHFDTASRIPPTSIPLRSTRCFLPIFAFWRGLRSLPIFMHASMRAASAIPTAFTTRRTPARSCAALPRTYPGRWTWTA